MEDLESLEDFKNLEDLKLGESGTSIDITASEENRNLAVAMVAQGRLSLDIVSRNLDPSIYDRNDFIESVKQLALSHSRARVRILVRDVASIMTGGHRLLTLAGRLSSFIELRKLSPQHKDFNKADLTDIDIVYNDCIELGNDSRNGTISLSDVVLSGDWIAMAGDYSISYTATFMEYAMAISPFPSLSRSPTTGAAYWRELP